MKNNKGISLITLLVTVIVLIIISSVTVYNGINMVGDAKKKEANDKLKTICSSILKDDSFLESGDTFLDRDDFDRMDLLRIYDNEKEYKVKKSIADSGDTKVVSYKLSMLDIKSSNEYSYEFSYNLNKYKYNYNVSFDESKGVNRPIIIDGMTALMPDEKTEVEDIYTSNWYNYEKGISNFAKMKYQDKTYVWIPRFAYDIQNFYEERKAADVPPSAISISFLRGTSSYMQNDEVMQGEYKVHPAFIAASGDYYSGIWVEKNPSETKGSLSYNINKYTGDENLHMMTNMECGASIYLMYALEAMNEIECMNDEYVAACANGVDDFDVNFVTVYTLNISGDIELGASYGDSFRETPWERIIEDYPTNDQKYVIRKFGSSLFDFTNSNGDDEVISRGAIAIK